MPESASLRSRRFFPALVMLSMLPVFAAAAPIAVPQPARFTLKAERGRYLLGQPVYLRIGSADGPPPSLEEGVLVLSIQGPDGTERDYNPPLHYRSGPAGEGSPRVRFARVIASDGALVFGKPGRYRLRLRPPPSAGADSGRRALSDSLSLVFAPPKREQDKRAFDLLSKDPGEYGLAVYLEGGQQLRSGMAIIRELASFPNGYRRMAAFVLSSDWSQDFIDRRGGGSRPLDLAKALEYAQWDLAGGAYVPLRNAFRLQAAADIQAVRDSTAPALAETRRKLAAFRASLDSAQAGLLRSF
jgi:hypothetical protein